MTRHAEIETNRETLRHIVVMLLGMADLAACASTRPCRARRESLRFLCQAEIVAWGLVLEGVYGLIAPPELIAWTFDRGGEPADAATLAVVLRALALTLVMRFALHRRFSEPRQQMHRNKVPLPAVFKAESRNTGPVVEELHQSAAARSPP